MMGKFKMSFTVSTCLLILQVSFGWSIRHPYLGWCDGRPVQGLYNIHPHSFFSSFMVLPAGVTSHGNVILTDLEPMTKYAVACDRTHTKFAIRNKSYRKGQCKQTIPSTKNGQVVRLEHLNFQPASVSVNSLLSSDKWFSFKKKKKKNGYLQLRAQSNCSAFIVEPI